MNRFAGLCVCFAFIWCFGAGSAWAAETSPAAASSGVPATSVPETDYNFEEVLAAAVAATSPTSASLEVPSISIPETGFNFGEMLETEPFSHDFIVKNGGKAPLHIKDVTPS
jgi:hypothetical protein